MNKKSQRAVKKKLLRRTKLMETLQLTKLVARKEELSKVRLEDVWTSSQHRT